MKRMILALAFVLLATPALAQTSTPPKQDPYGLTLSAGSGYDSAQTSGVFGEALVLHSKWSWSVGGGFGLPHGDGRIEGGLHFLVHQVDAIPRFAVGLTGYFIAPVSGYSDNKAITAVGYAVVFHVTPLFRFSAEYTHIDHGVVDAPANRKSGWGWSAMILLPFYYNGE